MKGKETFTAIDTAGKASPVRQQIMLLRFHARLVRLRREAFQTS
jgi:hypothetical protein